MATAALLAEIERSHGVAGEAFRAVWRCVSFASAVAFAVGGWPRRSRNRADTMRACLSPSGATSINYRKERGYIGFLQTASPSGR